MMGREDGGNTVGGGDLGYGGFVGVREDYTRSDHGLLL
jgi:hypothetical protein